MTLLLKYQTCSFQYFKFIDSEKTFYVRILVRIFCSDNSLQLVIKHKLLNHSINKLLLVVANFGKKS